MIFLFLSTVLVIQGDSLFSGRVREAEVSKDGIFSGCVIEKISGKIDGEVATDVAGEYFAIDGSVFFRGKKVMENKRGYIRLERYKGYTLALVTPDDVLYILVDGKVKDSIKIGIEGVSDFTVLDRTIYCFKGGDIYTLTLSGETKRFCSFPVKNITGILKNKGSLFVWTSEPGRVYQRKGGRWRVYYDPGITEINGIAIVGDTMFVSGNNVSGSELQGKVYSISGGEEKVIYEGTGILCGAQTSRGFICGEGEDGQVAVFHADGFKIIADFDEKEIVELHEEGKDILVCTGKPAGVYRITPVKSKRGEYITKVIDGGYGVVWGKVYWYGKGNVNIEYRTGRTSKVDTTWISWKTYKDRIESEDRYLQLKFVLTTGRDAVRSIELNFQERNHPPVIKNYGILPPGVGYGSAENAPFDREMMDDAQRKRWTRMGYVIPDGSYLVKMGNLRCIWWNSEDADGDDLVFSIYIKRKKDKKFQPVAEHITGNSWFLDVSPFPDGDYILKITAEDSPTSLFPESASVQVPFTIDNTPPVMKQTSSGKGRFKGLVEDGLTPVFHVFYKINEKEWRPARPVDGVFDSKKEWFVFEYSEGDSLGAVKVEDRLGNFRVYPVRLK